MACIQREERDRINQFVFAEDATLSLVKNNIVSYFYFLIN